MKACSSFGRYRPVVGLRLHLTEHQHNLAVLLSKPPVLLPLLVRTGRTLLSTSTCTGWALLRPLVRTGQSQLSWRECTRLLWGGWKDKNLQLAGEFLLDEPQSPLEYLLACKAAPELY